jgi:hypothetical protein
MSRRIARISARMALRTRTVSRSRTSMFIGRQRRPKRDCARPLAADSCGRRISEPTPWADFDFGLCTGGTPKLQNPVLVAFRDQPNARSSG